MKPDPEEVDVMLHEVMTRGTTTLQIKILQGFIDNADWYELTTGLQAYLEAFLEILKEPEELSVHLLSAIQKMIYAEIINELICPPMPSPLPPVEDKEEPWPLVFEWLDWYHHPRNPKGKGIMTHQELALLMDRKLDTVKGYLRTTSQYWLHVQDKEATRKRNVLELERVIERVLSGDFSVLDL